MYKLYSMQRSGNSYKVRLALAVLNAPYRAIEIDILRGEALQWMFFEQHALEPNIGAAYFWLALVKGGRDLQTHALEDWMERGYAALQVMENHLKTHDYFAAGQFTVADIALYGYTHVADQCDYDLSTFPAVRAWLRRVEQIPGFVAMDWQPSGGDLTFATDLAAPS
jgi:glutathione S-transferase